MEKLSAQQKKQLIKRHPSSPSYSPVNKQANEINEQLSKEEVQISTKLEKGEKVCFTGFQRNVHQNCIEIPSSPTQDGYH